MVHIRLGVADDGDTESSQPLQVAKASLIVALNDDGDVTKGWYQDGHM